MVTAEHLAELEATSRRYHGRSAERAEFARALRERGILDANEPDRVQRRLERLNCDWTLARALERTPGVRSSGRSLGAELRPEMFGADVLGLERLMGRNDLLDVRFLELGSIAGRSVGRITVRAGDGAAGRYGTGSLISPRLLLTNNHVLRSAREAARAHLELNYESGLDGMPRTPVAFALEPDALFVTDRALDFTVVAVTPRGTTGAELAAFGWLPLIEQQGKVLLGERVNIVQHPNGEPKQLAIRENEVVDLLDDFLHYTTDTAPGSSGAPVFSESWEVVGLHHSGVPKRDASGGYVAIDGGPWTEDMGEERLAWVANEGVRISRVLATLRAADLTGAAARLRAEVFEVGPVRPAPTPTASAITTRPPPDDPELRAALVALEASRARPYLDEAADAAASEAYYANIDARDGKLFAALSALVRETHLHELRYKPMRYVYPFVDLHEDGLLRSVYSGIAFPPERFIEEDAAIDAARTGRLRELIGREAALGPDAFAEELAALEAALPFNCEHVVPQSSFKEAEPMRGDVHHLFACESRCNSFRGNTPYFDFADFEETVRPECGRREDTRFEPVAGKGPVARATLYFLLRYPGMVGDAPQELQRERLELLQAWHRDHPVDRYERHRNMAVAELQGNRNPLIDHPEWAERIDFTRGFG